MKQNVEVPQVGESVTSGILAAWFRQNGELVQEGEDLFELETDKATMPVPAPASGVLTIRVETDTEVEVGAVVGEIDTAAAAPATEAAGDEAPGEKPAGAAAPPPLPVSPAVRRILEEQSLDAGTVTAAVTPSGKDGRLTKGDVEEYLRGAASGGPGASAPGAGATPGAAAAPSPGAVRPTPGAVRPAAPAPGSPPATPAPGTQERKKMTTLRRRIAENLVRSRQESAHLSTFNEVDMSAVMQIRTTYRDRFEKQHGVRLGFMSFFVKAAERSLREYPAVNAFVDGEDIVYNHFQNIGVAISTDRGLLVPVIRDVENLGFAAIEGTILDFATRAKEKRIMPDEFTGGTFTITNGGVFGSMLSTPIPSPPQTAVLGMHSIQKRAVVVNDEIVIRPMMYLALTYDHRVIDGREAIGFLNSIKNRIEDPTQLLLEL
ncbi:MAG: 2-oxoglutarate dehydrogenase complex dihydrolipoyllysine-residue succinyltransferase [Spirochaetaceae bacterium]|nr:MAG: 2-oxoglutarate dehydrogenase complex dihydrolipoyllysine-residue succinyltransferase [Spirochaetaceae bacterium]